MLAGKRVFLTGGGSGIGRQIALEMVNQRARVFLIGRRREALEETVKLSGAGAGMIAYAVCDIGIEAEVKSAVEKAAGCFGGLDTVVNNAALFWKTDIRTPELEDSWQKQFDINVMGTIRVIHAAMPYLLSNEAGSIVNLASVDAFSGCRGYTGYSATKGAVVSLTRGLALDLGEHGIRVNAVAPGITRTPMTQDRIDRNQAGYLSRLCVKRIGTDQDIADAVVYLASDKAGYITGEVLQVNGGMQFV